MTQDQTSREENNNYFMELSKPEYNRLLQQDDQITRVLPLSPASWSSKQEPVLDLACGPGGWTIEVAFRFPGIRVVGCDISSEILEYAQARALQEQIPVFFDQMDITTFNFQRLRLQPPYGLIHMRFAGSFLKKAQWLPLLEQCYTHTQQGGWIYLAEYGDWELPPSLHQLNLATAQALWKAEMNFSPDTYAYGDKIEELLNTAHYRNIEKKRYRLTWEGEAYLHFKKYMRLAVMGIQEFLVKKMKVLEQEEYLRLLGEALEELDHPNSPVVTTVDVLFGQKHSL